MSLPSLFARPWLRALALLASLLVLASLLWQSDEPRQPEDVRDLRGPTEPDSFVVNGRYLSFNERGQRTAVIESPRIEQFESRQTATMIAPTATLYDEESGTPWTLTAATGEFLQNRSILRLEQDVVVRRTLASGREGTLMTDRLTLDNNQRIVHTDAPVILTDQFSITEAVGMKAWIDDRILELRSQVESVYEPDNANQE
ncbi:MAG: LPS export ABC transporter periplasmic protein LptC [Marinobacter sp.]|uniref:LPS export ABC transporter periplasmic protein LptC n=1 Tax=Marinobacter sp. TaxID=50741 RepID=UPI00299EF1B0|nr:LPS export ABC transporter periplasmic protein LptC [Marinobacter sp.]MDX1633859.1 LPS export ABC transporter periplasmic protein LptC [Marinobacter sp.]